jgi:hypothetical protein
MSAVLIPRYHFKPSHYSHFKEYFDYYREQAEKGNKIDFYGKPTYWETFKSFLFVDAVLGILSLLLELKMYFLPTEGAKEVLDFCEGALGLFSAYTIIYILFFALHRWKIALYNRYVKKLILKSKNFQEFANNYHRKYSA